MNSLTILACGAAVPGKKLNTDGNGAVIGVIIEKDGKDLKVKANGGVILATGGFEHHKKMIASYRPSARRLCNDGDGMKMAMGVGPSCGTCPTAPALNDPTSPRTRPPSASPRRYSNALRAAGQPHIVKNTINDEKETA